VSCVVLSPLTKLRDKDKFWTTLILTWFYCSYFRLQFSYTEFLLLAKHTFLLLAKHTYLLLAKHTFPQKNSREKATETLTSKLISYKKPTKCTNFSNLFLEWNSICFGKFLCPSTEVFHCTLSNVTCHTCLLTACEQEHMLLLASCQQICMTYNIAVCTVKNSCWWTEELSETYRVSFQE